MYFPIKKSVSLAVAVLVMSSSSFAQTNNDLSASCRGEFSEKIIESLNVCSMGDLSKSYVEIGLLEAELAQTKSALEKKMNEVGKNGVSYNNMETVFNVSLPVAVLSGALALSVGITSLQMIAYGGTPKFFKVLGWGSLVTAGMSAAGTYLSTKEQQELRIQFSEIPKFVATIDVLNAQIKLRKTMLESMIQLKNSAKK